MNENIEVIISNVSKEFGLAGGNVQASEFILQLSNAIDKLLTEDFPRLVQILYRLDVDEQKLKNELKNNPVSAPGMLIAKLIVERQLQKAEAKRHFRRDEDIPEDEQW